VTAPCPTCSGPIRETVGMVCQTCGTDYGATPAPESCQAIAERIAAAIAMNIDGWIVWLAVQADEASERHQAACRQNTPKETDHV
jgi:hypothetical protein